MYEPYAQILIVQTLLPLLTYWKNNTVVIYFFYNHFFYFIKRPQRILYIYIDTHKITSHTIKLMQCLIGFPYSRQFVKYVTVPTPF